MQYRRLIWDLAERELQIRYRGSKLGLFWTFLIPLFTMCIYMFFMGYMMKSEVRMMDIMIGVFAWQFTVQCINSGVGSITGNANLVKKVALPRIILPVAATVANFRAYLKTFWVQIPFLIVYFVAYGHRPGVALLLFPVIMLMHFVFNLALATLMGAINVSFRDLQHLVSVILNFCVFVTPVMYNMEFVEKSVGTNLSEIFLLNPMAAIITAYRDVLCQAATLHLTPAFGVALLIILLLAWLAKRVFVRLERDFADDL